MEGKNKRISRLFSMEGASDALLLNQSHASLNEQQRYAINTTGSSQIEFASVSNPN